MAELKTGAQVLTTTTASNSLDYLGTVHARVGYLVAPTLLVYGTGGLAYGGINLNTSVGQFATTPAFAPGFGGASASSTRVGWTAGGGLEWMFLPNWSAKLEYLYYDLGSVNASVPLGGGNPLLYSSALLTTASFNGQIVRVGLNYHFNWGAPTPVVAKCRWSAERLSPTPRWELRHDNDSGEPSSPAVIISRNAWRHHLSNAYVSG